MFSNMNEQAWINAGLAISGVLTGLLAGRIRLGKSMNLLNGSSPSTDRMLAMVKFESEINNILRSMRSDMDDGFNLMKDQHAEMLRRLRKHDDELFDIKARLDKLERQ